MKKLTINEARERAVEKMFKKYAKTTTQFINLCNFAVVEELNIKEQFDFYSSVAEAVANRCKNPNSELCETMKRYAKEFKLFGTQAEAENTEAESTESTERTESTENTEAESTEAESTQAETEAETEAERESYFDKAVKRQKQAQAERRERERREREAQRQAEAEAQAQAEAEAEAKREKASKHLKEIEARIEAEAEAVAEAVAEAEAEAVAEAKAQAKAEAKAQAKAEFIAKKAEAEAQAIAKGNAKAEAETVIIDRERTHRLSDREVEKIREHFRALESSRLDIYRAKCIRYHSDTAKAQRQAQRQAEIIVWNRQEKRRAEQRRNREVKSREQRRERAQAETENILSVSDYLLAERQDIRKHSYYDSMHTLESVTNNDSSELELAKAVIYFALASAQSVLKKLADPQRKTAQHKVYKNKETSSSGCNPQIMRVRGELQGDTERLLALSDMVNTCETVPFVSERLSEGAELLNVACLSILEQIADCEDIVDFSETIEEKRLSRRVYTDRDTERELEVDTIKRGQKVFRDIRRFVSNNRALKVNPTCKYMYISEMVNESGEIITDDRENEHLFESYLRLSAYSQLADYVNDNIISVKSETVYSIERLIESMNLTSKQAKVLELRLRGYGKKEVAKRLGIDKTSVRDCLRLIEKKAKASEEIMSLKEKADRRFSFEAVAEAKADAKEAYAEAEAEARQEHRKNQFILKKARQAQREAERAQAQAIIRAKAELKAEADRKKALAEAEAVYEKMFSKAERREHVRRKAQAEAEAVTAFRKAETEAQTTYKEIEAQAETVAEAVKARAQAEAQAEAERLAQAESKNLLFAQAQARAKARKEAEAERAKAQDKADKIWHEKQHNYLESMRRNRKKAEAEAEAKQA